MVIAFNCDSEKTKTDKAKPWVIMGRKATGPSGMAGLPKSDGERTGLPWLPFKSNPVFNLRKKGWIPWGVTSLTKSYRSNTILESSLEEKRQAGCVSFLTGALRPCLGGRCTMIPNEEFMACLLSYGRGTVQDIITRSRNIGDVIQYMRAERGFEILRLTSFVTRNLINFEKKES